MADDNPLMPKMLDLLVPERIWRTGCGLNGGGLVDGGNANAIGTGQLKRTVRA